MNVCAAAWLARNDSTIAKERAMVLEYCYKLKRTKHDKTIQKRASDNIYTNTQIGRVGVHNAHASQSGCCIAIQLPDQTHIANLSAGRGQPRGTQGWRSQRGHGHSSREYVPRKLYLEAESGAVGV